MTHTAGEAGADDHPILHAAIALIPEIRAAADVIEHERRLPKQIVDAIKHAGILGMPMPRAWGGPELDPSPSFVSWKHWRWPMGPSAGAP
jgi:alkylation response protein AidB-like acyl-CoA dehydrogenase